MAIGRITGAMLFSNLERQGQNLAIDSDLAYYDVGNRRIGVNTSAPGYSLDVNGNAHLGNLILFGNTITSESGSVNLRNITNITISGGRVDYIVRTDGNGNLTFVDLNSLPEAIAINANISAANVAIASINANVTAANAALASTFGNTISLGANTVAALVSNAVALTTTTKVTDAISQLNYVLGKLVPPSPPNFPNNQTLSLSGMSTYTGLMATFAQTDNTGWGNLAVSAGSFVTTYRSNSYATNFITSCGPGNSGTISVYLNGQSAGSTTLTGSSNGTYGNLQIANNQDYHNVISTVTAGFWSSFDAQATGSSVPAGWNRVYIVDTVQTNNVIWYYDSSSPSTPSFSATSIVLSSNVVSYSSTVPHFTSSAGFTIRGNVTNLSGDTYPNSTYLFNATSAGGAFGAPTNVTYSAANITLPLPKLAANIAKFTTTANIVSGFGSSSGAPSVSVTNNYNTGSASFSTGNIILYKTGTGNQIEETALPIGSVGSGSGIPFRIVNPGSSDTPAYTGSESAFNSQTSPLLTYDATVVGAVLKFDQTDYSTGYLPVGPNLSGQASNQYFTFKFVRSSVSKFNINYTGSIAGLWVALPGSAIDTTSSLNGWLTLGTSYGGAGVPGVNSPGNGSNGCALGGIATFGSSGTYALTATFGTVSSSSTAANEIYVRIKLTSGQSVTALSIQTATN